MFLVFKKIEELISFVFIEIDISISSTISIQFQYLQPYLGVSGGKEVVVEAVAVRHLTRSLASSLIGWNCVLFAPVFLVVTGTPTPYRPHP